MDEGRGEEPGLLGGLLSPPPSPLPVSPGSEVSLGEMMRCLVLLQRWGMFPPDDTEDSRSVMSE